MNQGANEFDATSSPILETMLYWSRNCGVVIRCGQLMSQHCAEGAVGNAVVFNQHVGVDPTIKWRWQVICFKIITKRAILIQISVWILSFLSFSLIIPFTYSSMISSFKSILFFNSVKFSILALISYFIHHLIFLSRFYIILFFYVSLTVHLSITLANDQLDAQILIHLLQSSTCTCFEQYLAHPQEVKLY